MNTTSQPENDATRSCAPVAGSTFRLWGDDYLKIADLGNGWTLIAHPNGPAISNGDGISTIDIYEGESIAPREIKIRAQQAFREWAWPRLKSGLTFPSFGRPNTKPSNSGQESTK